jgi:hypothetical protein
MLQSVDIGERSLDAYRGAAPEATIDELRRQAEDLRGARVLHINATPYGGGVSEPLRSTVPLLDGAQPRDRLPWFMTDTYRREDLATRGQAVIARRRNERLAGMIGAPGLR